MILEIRNLRKEYKRKNEMFLAVNDVNLSISKGEFVSIVGHSGCGKSTLLNMVAGLLRPTDGEILIHGSDVSEKNEKELALLRNETIGYILQGQNLLSNFTILDNICMPAYLSPRKKIVKVKALELLEEVGLKGMDGEYPANLSGGELRRVSIIRALINSPEILIADEPTSNLDPENSKMVMKLFKEISDKGTTVLISTHDLEFLDYTHKNYEMKKGILK
ncbi:ABC transporter ATP-binding protein [Clostridium sp. CS001]|uniref:ABC transporter ATP-binding protein n=1 Tax=Clostridium sp. CS001 TaxID=2880648 RepID=UPI001CF5B448|nr:ABC transporter ATP-binding protein [Clostridium sp. CS001]MCB2289927.1 ABC transporter ATP-binding protein [Clostridium sp. CS001]